MAKDDGTVPELMTAMELAEYLKVSRSTVYKLLRDGHVPFINVGGDYRFDRHQIDRWMAKPTGEGLIQKKSGRAPLSVPARSRLVKGGQTPVSTPSIISPRERLFVSSCRKNAAVWFEFLQGESEGDFPCVWRIPDFPEKSAIRHTHDHSPRIPLRMI